jgi:formate/nitrite transporter FocA (FNT family)
MVEEELGIPGWELEEDGWEEVQVVWMISFGLCVCGSVFFSFFVTAGQWFRFCFFFFPSLTVMYLCCYTASTRYATYRGNLRGTFCNFFYCMCVWVRAGSS